MCLIVWLFVCLLLGVCMWLLLCTCCCVVVRVGALVCYDGAVLLFVCLLACLCVG